MFLKEDWEFNVSGIYNYKKPGPLKHYFNFIKNNHNNIDGDIVEAGVYKGRSLLGVGLLLKELGSEKKVFGFDSYSGFPLIYHKNDDINRFKFLLKKGLITKVHYSKVQKNIEYRSFDLQGNMKSENISLSGNFSQTSVKYLQKKIDYFKLKNIVLVDGPFEKTMINEKFPKLKVMAALIDCDLYNSYKVTLPFFWDKLVQKGYIFIDEYYSLKFPGARTATDEFFVGKVEKPQMHEYEDGDFERWYVTKQ